MASSATVATYKRYMELVSTGRLDELAEVVDVASYREECVGVTPGWIGFEQSKQSYRPILAAFPDQQITYDEVVAVDDRVFTRYHLRAIHAGPLFGAPPTNRSVEWQACDFVRVANGKIVERWFLADLLGVLRQTGLVPDLGSQ
jgi:predicted ester cyclase